MPPLAIVHKPRTPGLGQPLGTLKAAVRVVAAAHQHGRERQGLARNGRPAVDLRGQVGPLHIARRHQQRAAHLGRVPGVRRPPGRQDAAQAVRRQYNRAVGIGHGLFQARRPVAAQRAHPVVLLHALVAVRSLPAALPVVGARVLPAGQQQDVGGFHYYQFNS